MANSPYELPDDYESPYQAMAAIDITGIQKNLEEVSAAKRGALEAAKARQEIMDANYKASFAGVLGAKGFEAVVADVPARIANSVGRVGAGILSATTKLGMLPITSAVTDEDVQAYNRIQIGEALPGDEERMQSTFIGGGDYTVRDILQLGEDTDSWIRALNDNATPANTLDTRQMQFMEELQRTPGTAEALDAISEGTWEGAGTSSTALGFGKAVWDLAKTAVNTSDNNPIAAFQYVLDNSAQMALGAYSKPLLAAFTAGYATDYYTKGIQAYADAHQGQLPVGDDHTEILAKAASLGAAEYIGTVTSLGASAIPRAVARDLTEATGESLLKQALKGANERIGDAATKLGTAVAGEALTEGYQTAMESNLQGKEATPMEIYTGAVIGGVSGGGMAVPGATAALTVGATDAAIERAKAKAEDARLRKEELAAAIKSGDITPFVAKDSKKYNPLKAMEILQSMASDKSRTEEERSASLTKAQELYDTLNAELADTRKELKQQGIIESTVAEIKDALQETKEYTKKVLAENPDKDVSGLNKEIARLENALKLAKTPDVKAKMQQVSMLQSTLNTVQPMIREASVAATKTAETAPEVTETAQPSTATVSPKKVSKNVDLIIRSIMDIGAMTPDEANALANDTTNDLTLKQRKYLKRFSEARLAENAVITAKGVNSTIMRGDPRFGNLGLPDYRNRMAQAVREGNYKRQNGLQMMLGRWMEYHTSKLSAATKAFESLKNSTEFKYIAPNEQGIWGEVDVSDMTPAQQKQAGVISIHHTRSKHLIPFMQSEVKAMQAAYAELEAMADGVLETSPVDLDSAQGTQTVAAPAAPAAEAAPATPAATPAATTPPAAPAGKDAGAVAPTKKPVDQITADDWSAIIGYIEGPARPDGPNENIDTDTFLLLKKMVIKIIKDGVKDGTPRERIIQQIEGVTKGGVSNKAMSNIHSLLDAQTVNASAPAAPAAPESTQKTQEEAVNTENVQAPTENTQAPVEEVQAPTEDAQVSEESTEVPVENTEVSTEVATAQETLPAPVQQEETTTAAVTEEPANPVVDVLEQSSEQPVEVAEVPDAPMEGASDTTVEQVEKTNKGTLQALVENWRGFGDKFIQKIDNGEFPRPLAVIKDFFSAWRKNGKMVYDYISEKDGELTPEQSHALNTFRDTLKQWVPLVDTLITPVNDKEVYRALHKVFVKEVTDTEGNTTWVMEENVKTAIAAAAITFIQNQGGQTYKRTDTEINLDILNRDKEAYVTPEERRKYQSIGETRQKVIDELAQSIKSMLGLDIKPSTEGAYGSRMDSALGVVALNLLMQVGSVRQHNETVGAEGGTNTNSVRPYIQFANVWEDQRGDTNYDAMNKRIAASSKGSQSILSRFMGIEHTNHEPTLKPEVTTQQDMHIEFQEVPENQLQHLNEMNKVENYIDPAMMQVMTKLSTAAQDAVIGVEWDGGEDGKYIQKTRIEGVRASNDSLRRNLDNAISFFTTVLKQDYEIPFFLKHMPWTQGRAGIGQNVLNPNTDKIARRLVTRRSWQSKIDLSNETAVNGFMIAVAAALHIDIDKKSHEAALQDVKAKLGWDGKTLGGVTFTNSVYMDAVNALKDIIFEDATPTTEMEAAITKAVAAGEEKMHSLQALVALAEMQYSLEQNIPEFTTKLTLEVDGVTNGPMLTMLLWGAYGDPRMLEKGGFFSTWSTHENYNVYRGEPNVKDLYETIAAIIVKFLNTQNSGEDKRILAGAYAITGALEKDGVATASTRKLVKLPLTQLFFGSGMKTIRLSVQDYTIDAFYTKLEKAALSSMEAGGSRNALNALVTGLNQLLYVVNDGKIIEDYRVNLQAEDLLENPAEFWLNFEMTPNQLRVFRQNIDVTLGNAMESTLESAFDKVLDAKTHIVRASNLAFTIYKAVYDYLFVQASKGTGTLSKERRVQLEKFLEPMFPRMHTAFSKTAKNGLAAALPLMDKKSKEINYGPEYKSEIKVPTYTLVDGSTKTSMRVQGLSKNLAPPSVRAAPMGIHGLDGRTSQDAQKNTEALNNHDAHMTGIEAIELQARRLNESLWNNMMDYSPVREVADGLVRVLDGLGTILTHVKNEKTEQGIIDAVIRSMPSFEKNDGTVQYNTRSIAKTLFNILNAADAADYAKYTAMSSMKYINQYGYEGGSYVVTNKDRQLAANKAKQVAAESNNFSEKHESTYVFVYTSLNTNGINYEAPKDVPFADPANVLSAAKALESTLILRNQKKTRMFTVLQAIIKRLETKDKTATNEIAKVELMHVYDAMATIWKESLSQQGIIEAPENTNDTDTLAEDTTETITGKDGNTIREEEVIVPSMNDVPVQQMSDMPVQPRNVTNMLHRALRRDGGITVKNMLTLLTFQAGKPDLYPDSKFHLMLFKELVSILPDVEIKLVTQDTKLPTNVVFAPKEYGKFVLDKGKSTIYLLDTGNISEATLMHELLHAGLSRALVVNPEYANELNALMERVKNEITPEQFETFKAAFENVDEFLAYGMTDTAFQKILSDLRGYKVERTLMDYFRGFVTAAMRALGFNATHTSALRRLMYLGAELIEKVAEESRFESEQTIVRSITVTAGDVRNYSTQDIFDALDTQSVSRGFSSHLRGLLTNMVAKLHGPYGVLGKEAMRQQPMGPLDIYFNALGKGSLPFASNIQASGVKVSDQEQFVAEQIEATIRASLKDNAGQVTAAYTQLARMYEEAYKRFPTPESMIDWAASSPEEQEQAKALHAFLFNIPKTTDGRSNHLSQFAAMILAVEDVSQMFGYGSKNRDNTFDTSTLLGRFLKWFDSVLDWFDSRATSTYTGQAANEKVKALVATLVEIEAKKRALVYSRGKSKMPGDYIEEGAAYLTNKAKESLVKFSESDFFTKSKNTYLRAGGAVVNTIASDTLDNFGDTLRKFRDYASKDKHGILMSLITEIRGDTDNTAIFYKMLKATKHIEATRQAAITRASNLINNAFLNHKSFGKQHNEAISTYMLRTGMYVLMDKYSMVEIEQMLSNPEILKANIAEHEKELIALSPRHAKFWIVGGKSLGYKMITGKAKFAHIANPYILARAGGLSFSKTITESLAVQAEPIIDRLATLQAILSGPNSVRKGAKINMGSRDIAATVMREENARQANGVEFMLLLHKQQMEKSKQTIFKDSEALMRKGYTPDILNPHVEIEMVNAEEGSRLKKIGYTRHFLLERDRHDPNQEQLSLYSIKGSGMRPWLSGIFSTTNMGAKGSKQLEDNLNPFTVAGMINQTVLDNVVGAKEHDMRSLFHGAYTGFDPGSIKEEYMVPTFNADMKVVNYRYEMQEHTKDTILERDNRFAHILGTLEGNIYDKMTSPEQNRLAAQALYDHYQANKAMDAKSYVYVGFDSTDPEMQDIANKFPEHTRQAIRKIWGMNGMMVRKDMLDINFGYRKWSATEALFQSAAEKQLFARMVVDFFEFAFSMNGDEESRKIAGERARRWLLNKGDIWEEIVVETKDIIVVKTGTVMMNNIISNMLELKAFGVPMMDILRHHRTAIKASIAHRKDAEELFGLEKQLETGFTQGNTAAIERRIAVLKDAMIRNPVHQLMEEGLMPTIVEDVADNEDIYSHKAALATKVAGITKRAPAVLTKAARFVYMAHDTTLYKTLSEITQLSDFVARYTLYQHEINKKNPLSHDEAVRKVSDAFINYDIPSHRKLQWGNDMGLVMFTKYYIRIQKVILRTMRDNPMNATLMLLLNNYMDALPMLYDSGVLGDSYGGGLFGWGALEYPGTLDNLLTVDAVF